MPPLKLEDMGYKLGDLVTYDDDEHSTGGIIFVISDNFDSPVPDAERHTWNSRGAGDQYAIKGRRLKPMEVYGYLRLRPIFSFFPTSLGKKPLGAGGTVLVHHTELKKSYNLERMKHLDLVTLGTKYLELGNVMQDLARAGGMTPTIAHTDPHE